MLRLRGTFDGEYLSFDLVASLTRLQDLLAAHVERRYPGECVTVTVCLHHEVRGRVSRRHEEYVFAPVWDGREWIVWEAPQEGPAPHDQARHASLPAARDEDHADPSRLQLPTPA
jgi:hypothetical protein